MDEATNFVLGDDEHLCLAQRVPLTGHGIHDLVPVVGMATKLDDVIRYTARWLD